VGPTDLWRASLAPARSARQGAKGTRLPRVGVQPEGDAWPTTERHRPLRPVRVVVGPTSTRRPQPRRSPTSGAVEGPPTSPRLRPTIPRHRRLGPPWLLDWSSTRRRPMRVPPGMMRQRHSTSPVPSRPRSPCPHPCPIVRSSRSIPVERGSRASTTDRWTRTHALSCARPLMAPWERRSSAPIPRTAARRSRRRSPSHCVSRSSSACRRGMSTARDTFAALRSRSRHPRRSCAPDGRSRRPSLRRSCYSSWQ
jgi:hypothetical protein